MLRGCLRFSVVECLIRRRFGNRASPTLCEGVMLVAYAGKTLRLAKLDSSLGGLCIGQELGSVQVFRSDRFLGQYGSKGWAMSSTQILVDNSKKIIKLKEYLYWL